jgi:hypothetical protein
MSESPFIIPDAHLRPPKEVIVGPMNIHDGSALKPALGDAEFFRHQAKSHFRHFAVRLE